MVSSHIAFALIAIAAWQFASADPEFQKRNELSNYLLVKFCSQPIAQELPVCKTVLGGLKLGKRDLQRARKSIFGDLFNIICSWPGIRTLEVCEERKNATTTAAPTTRYPTTQSNRTTTPGASTTKPAGPRTTASPSTSQTTRETTLTTQFRTHAPETSTQPQTQQPSTTQAPETTEQPSTTQAPETTEQPTTTQQPEEPSTTPVPEEPSTTAQPTGDWKRTVVFIKKQTNFGQDLFILGGIDHMRRPECQDRADASNECAIPIKHQTKFDASFTKYADWSQGDNYLDWYGAEKSQGVHDGESSAGTPLVWSTNDVNTIGYQPLNTYGPHYWMLDVDMDCSKTDGGWFEFKAYTGGNWEPMFFQQQCTGSAGGRRPFESINHAGRCGFVNVYEFASPSCEIENL